MRIVHFIYFIVFLFPSFLLQAQDKIYLNTSIKEGKILKITTENIEYRTTVTKDTVLTVITKDVKIIFNNKGHYLVPSRWNRSDPGFAVRINQFLSEDDLKFSGQKDIIYTNTKTKIEGNIVIEDNFYLVLANDQKISKNTVAAIVYSMGNQKIYGQLDSVAGVLWAIQQNSPIPIYAPAPLPERKATDAGDTQSRSDSARKIAFDQIAGDISRKEFEQRAIQKTNKLNEYLKILCSKSASYEKSNEATDQAVNLFVNEDAKVVTSSIKTNTVNSYKIRTYLTRVKLFKYDKIEIEWTHVQYVSDLKMGKDGNFYGVVSFEQVFRGYRDNQLIYSDITKKNAVVVLKTYDKNYEGSTKTVWDVLLSDIGVVYTKADE
jgi:hypothetical protein